MILRINSTSSEQILVELKDKNKNMVRITQKQKLGSQTLLPLIFNNLKKHKIKPFEISAIEVNTGPGSFTGTRIGVAIANALGFALNVSVNGKKGKMAQPIYEKSKFD